MKGVPETNENSTSTKGIMAGRSFLQDEEREVNTKGQLQDVTNTADHDGRTHTSRRTQ